MALFFVRTQCITCGEVFGHILAFVGILIILIEYMGATTIYTFTTDCTPSCLSSPVLGTDFRPAGSVPQFAGLTEGEQKQTLYFRISYWALITNVWRIVVPIAWWFYLIYLREVASSYIVVALLFVFLFLELLKFTLFIYAFFNPLVLWFAWYPGFQSTTLSTQFLIVFGSSIAFIIFLIVLIILVIVIAYNVTDAKEREIKSGSVPNTVQFARRVNSRIGKRRKRTTQFHRRTKRRVY